MGSKSSKTTCPTSAKNETVIIPRIPQDTIDEILDHLAAAKDFGSLRACALVSKSWVRPCQRHLFRTVAFTSRSVDSWFKTFPAPQESPAHRVGDLRIWIGGDIRVPEKFFEYTPWFKEVYSMRLLGYGGLPLSRGPLFWKLPQSVTSLAIDTCVVTLIQVRDIMAQLPNLDDLSLSGSLVAVNRKELPGIGTALRGRFGGRLMLCSEYVNKGALDVLLEIPTGLHFTEMWIGCTRERLPSAVRLAEACCKTVVKLSHMVIFHCKFSHSSWFW